MSQEAPLPLPQERSASTSTPTPTTYRNPLPSGRSTNTPTTHLQLRETPVSRLEDGLEAISQQFSQVSIAEGSNTPKPRSRKRGKRTRTKESTQVIGTEDTSTSASKSLCFDRKLPTPAINSKQETPLPTTGSIEPSSSKKTPASAPRKKDHTLFKAGRKKKTAMGSLRDSKTPPSKASGGIPQPTHEYIFLASSPPELLPVAQQLLVVIDLNGTIIYRGDRNRPTNFTLRPNAALFLEYCINTFAVVIWSSARPHNVDDLLKSIIPPALLSKVVAVWARDKFNLTPEDYNLRVQCYKRLSALWSDPSIASTHPEFQSGGRWNQTNTVLIDDSMEKGRSEPYNLIEIPEFLGDEAELGGILPQVHDYLNHLSKHSNVSACLKAYPWRPIAVAAPQSTHREWTPNSDEIQVLPGPPENWDSQVRRRQHKVADKYSSAQHQHNTPSRVSRVEVHRESSWNLAPARPGDPLAIRRLQHRDVQTSQERYDSYGPVQYGEVLIRAPRTSDFQPQKVEKEPLDWRIAAGLPSR